MKEERSPSEGLCYGCRHPGEEPPGEWGPGHCFGTGDLEPTPGAWPGFVCTCRCRPTAGTLT